MDTSIQAILQAHDIQNISEAAIERAICEKSFYEFAIRAWQHIDTSVLVLNWHFEAICNALQAVADGATTRLLINVPPGCAKSMIVSVLFPAWMWTHRPSWRAVSASHSFEFAKRDTRRSRELIRSEWYQSHWPIQFSDDQDQKQSYENTHRGFRVAKPMTGITGERGNCVIIDDPHSVDDAKSEATRTSVVENFLEAVPNRLNDLEKDAIIVIMQRLHEEDVAGTILDMELGYDHLCIPMEYEGDPNDTPWGYRDPRTEDGELMFPVKFSRKAVDALKKSLRTSYAGQYQQRPAPREAGEIDKTWFEHTRYDLGEHPQGCNYYMTSDHAPAGNKDYNVFRIWGIDHKRHLWLVDSFRKQCKMDVALGIKRDDEGKLHYLPSGALHLIRRWKPLAFFPEDDNNWKSVGDLFKQALREAGLFVRIEPQPTGGLGDKVVKAQSFCTLAALGQVHLPRGTIGDTALAEYVMFPNGKHDDQVDADGMIGRVQTQLRAGWQVENEERPTGPNDYRSKRSNHKSDSDAFFL